jgi:hypothetical protein
MPPSAQLRPIGATLAKATRMPDRNLFQRRRNFLIGLEITAMREVCKIRAVTCYCQPFSRLPISSHMKPGVLEVAVLRYNS